MPRVTSCKSKKYFVLFFALMVLCLAQASVCISAPFYPRLTILHTNDRHGHMFPYEYLEPGKDAWETGSAAQMAAMIRDIKKSTNHPVLVMDAGDVFTHGPLANLMGEPDFNVMNAVPYDIMTLGNYEFAGDDGLKGQKVLFDRIKQAKFPVVSANVVYKSTNKTIVPPYHIFEIEGYRVGVFGLTTTKVVKYSQAQGLLIKDPIATAKEIVAELRDKSDFIIALTHIGYPSDLELAAAEPYIDVIIGGDSHTVLDQPTLVRDTKGIMFERSVGGPIVCQAGVYGAYLGKLDLTLHGSGKHSYKVVQYKGELIPIKSSTKPAQDVAQILDKYSKPYQQQVGKINYEVPANKAAEWVAQCIREATKAQIGIAPKYGIGNGLKSGGVTRLDIRKINLFINRVVTINATGKQISEFINGEDSGLSGMQSQNGELYIADKKLEDNKTYTVAIEDYYASTSPAFMSIKPKKSGMTTRDIIFRYITGKNKQN